MFHKSIQYALEKLGESKSGFERTVVSKFKRKRRVGSGNELVDYSRAPCLGADQKARGLWERDCKSAQSKTFRQIRHVRVQVWSSHRKAADTHCAVSPKRIQQTTNRNVLTLTGSFVSLVLVTWLHEIAQTYHPDDSWVCFLTNAFYLDT